MTVGLRSRGSALLLAAVLGMAATVLVPGQARAADVQISGTVTGTGGTGLASIAISVYSPDPDGGWEWNRGWSTDQDGHYAVPVPSGTYRIEFGFYPSSNPSGYLGEFYPNADTVGAATTVDATGGSVSGIDAQLDLGGRISGTVPQLSPKGGYARAFGETTPGDWTEVASSFVPGGTTYELRGLRTGAYKVRFSSFGPYAPEYYDNSADLDGATPVAVTAGSTTTGIDATLAPVGRVTGHVVLASGAPAKDESVQAYEKQGTTWVPHVGLSAPIGGNGRYTLRLPAGQFRLGFGSAVGLVAPEFYPNVRRVSAATTVTVTSGGTVTGRNAVLERPGTIVGRATSVANLDSFSYPAHLSVRVFDALTGQLYPTPYGVHAVTAHSFSYTVTGLSPGISYRLELAREDGPATVEGQYFGNHPEGAGPGSAKVFTIVSGQVKRGLDAVLRIGGTLTGYVLRTDGSSAKGCTVSAYAGDGSLAIRSGTVGSDGRFRITGLTTADYRLKLTPGDSIYLLSLHRCGTPEYFKGGSGALTKDENDGTTVHATAGRDALLSTPLYYGPGTAPTLPDIQNTALPTATGTLVVGRTLTASAGTWTPLPLQVRYQWLRDDVALAGKVSSSYLLGTADRGHQVSVRITAYAVGDDPGVAYSVKKTVSSRP